jgi:SAM-dependent methyltransferase
MDRRPGERQKLEGLYRAHHLQGRRLRQSFLERRRAEIFQKWLGAGKKILDLGCRDGVLTQHFTQGNDIIGLDIDSNALGYASRTYGIRTMQADLNAELPFPENTFDATVMGEVLEHLPYPAITLGEVQRVLKRGGIFIGSVPLAYHLIDRSRVLRGKKLLVDGDPTHLQHFTLDDLQALLSRFFQLEELEVLKGGRWAQVSMKLFARDVAFQCRKGS